MGVTPETEKKYAEIEPCGCEESCEMKELLESLVEYEQSTDPDHDGEDCGCIRCCAEALLAALEKKRAAIRADVRRDQPKQGVLPWE